MRSGRAGASRGEHGPPPGDHAALKPLALPALLAADGVRQAGGVADLWRWAVVEAGEVAADHVRHDLVGIGIAEAVADQPHRAADVVSDHAQPAGVEPADDQVAADRESPPSRCSTERRRVR